MVQHLVYNWYKLWTNMEKISHDLGWTIITISNNRFYRMVSASGWQPTDHEPIVVPLHETTFSGASANGTSRLPATARPPSESGHQVILRKYDRRFSRLLLHSCLGFLTSNRSYVPLWGEESSFLKPPPKDLRHPGRGRAAGGVINISHLELSLQQWLQVGKEAIWESDGG